MEQMGGWATVTHARARTKPLSLKTSRFCDCRSPGMMPPVLTKAVACGLSQDFLATISQSNTPSRHLDVPARAHAFLGFLQTPQCCLKSPF